MYAFNPIITITDVARTPRNQASIMYNNLQSNGIISQKGVYKQEVHSVIDIYENLTKTNQSKEVILDTMEEEIKRLISLGYFQHCQDFSIKNTFDVSVWRFKNPKDFFRIAKQYENNHSGFYIIDERRNAEQCYHIEIEQP